MASKKLLEAERKAGWIGIDGEGVTQGTHLPVYTTHDYVLICAGGAHVDYTEDVNGLSSSDIFSWLLSLPEEPRICGYYLMYDYTHWVKDLPNRAIYELFRPELRRGGKKFFRRIRWRGYQLHWMNGMFEVSRGKNTRRIWDISKFYQCSFVDACRKAGVGLAELDAVDAMKQRRSKFSEHELDEIRDYCLLECRLLAELATKLEGSHRAIGVVPKTWFGPGSTASVVLKRHSISEARGDVPIAVEDIADRAFFGGWFEHSCIGRKENVYGYDLVSAYPAQTLELPCLEHGRWKKVSAERALDSSVAAIRVCVANMGPRSWAPLPCRLSDGRVLHPRGGFDGWYWRSEVLAALDGWPRGIELLQGWVCEKTCDCQPFAFVKKLFEARKNGSLEEKQVYKLVINSLYGKLAQRVGNPTFASVVWAGLITAGTRARLLSLMTHHRDISNVYAVATDGLYSSEQIHVSNNGVLGSWKREPHGAVWFVRPGIYWAENDPVIRARGLGRKKLAEEREKVERAVLAGASEVDLGFQPAFGAARETIYRVPTTGRIKRSLAFGQWHPLPVRMSLRPEPKRGPDWMPPVLDGVESRPYTAPERRPQLIELANRLLEGLRA